MKFKQQNNKNNLKINPKNNKNIPLELLVEILKASINPIDVQRQITRKHLENKLGINSKITANMCKMKLFGIYWRKHIKTMLTTSKIIYQFIGYKYLKREKKHCFIAISMHSIPLVIEHLHHISRIYNIQNNSVKLKLKMEVYKSSENNFEGLDENSAMDQSNVNVRALTGEEKTKSQKKVTGKSLLAYPVSGICPICNKILKESSWNQHINGQHREFLDYDASYAMLFSESNVRAFIKKTLTKLGYDRNHNHIVQLADLVIFADKYGYYSEGLRNIGNYVSSLTQGIINIEGQPTIIRQNGGVAHVDGSQCFGVVTGNFCTDLALNLSFKYGIGVVTTNAHLLGPKHFYIQRMVKSGCSGFVYNFGSSISINKKSVFYEIPEDKIYEQLRIVLSFFAEDFTELGQCFFVRGRYTVQAISDENMEEFAFSNKRYEAYDILFAELHGGFRYSQDDISNKILSVVPDDCDDNMDWTKDMIPFKPSTSGRNNPL